MPCSDWLTLPSAPLPPTAVTVTGTLTPQGGLHTTALVRTGPASLHSRDGILNAAVRSEHQLFPGLVPEMVPLWEMLYVYLAVGCRILEDGLLRPLASGLHPDAKRWKVTHQHTLLQLA